MTAFLLLLKLYNPAGQSLAPSLIRLPLELTEVLHRAKNLFQFIVLALQQGVLLLQIAIVFEIMLFQVALLLALIFQLLQGLFLSLQGDVFHEDLIQEVALHDFTVLILKGELCEDCPKLFLKAPLQFCN